MAFELVERTQKQASRLHLSIQADACAKWLKANGFTVLSVERGHDIPRITIQHSPLCEQLEGAVFAYSRSAKGERRYGVVTRFECEVWWEVWS